MDPNAELNLHPASDATIAALPREKYADVKTADGEVECLVCKEAFKDEQVVIVLPCTHIFCADGCTEAWLKNRDNCPKCRATVPAVEGTQEADTVAAEEEETAEMRSDGNAEQDAAMDTVDAADVVAEKEIEDVVMEDA